MSSAGPAQVLQNRAIHPGRFLQDELEEIGLSAESLAVRIGRPVKAIKRVLQGRAPITRPLARDLADATETQSSLWLKLQESYDEAIERLGADLSVQEDVALLGMIPWRDFQKAGWVQNVGTDIERVGELRTHFDVETLSDIESSQHAAAFRITQKTKFDPWALAAWLQQGEWQVVERNWETQAEQSARFDSALFEQSLAEIRGLTVEPDFWPRMRSYCAKAGVHLELVPHVPKSGANGVTRWMDDGRPLIQLSLFRGMADVFWFTFFHEAAHVLREHRRNIYINLDRVPREDDAEREADDFARDFLIPPDHWQPYWDKVPCSRASINRLAKDVGVHPGVVVGRLQHESRIPYSTHNELRAKLDYGLFVVDELS